jgi:HK97 family phage prohead protease
VNKVVLRSAAAPLLAFSSFSGEGGAVAEREVAGQPLTLFGHFARFNEWTEIDSIWEGRFLERVAPGAFARTLTRDRDSIKVLFQHGKDPQVGSKPLGVPAVLREDEQGAAYEVPLLDTSYNRELVPGLRAGVYGASFRFSIQRELFVQKPERSSYNPDGLPERTIQEANLFEFGPVSFPAYQGATAGVRSLTDWYLNFTAQDIRAPAGWQERP